MPSSPDILMNDVRAALARASLGPEDLLIVGLSGGVDSQTLTHCLVKLRDRDEGPTLQAVHVDHRLRPGSTRDAVQCTHVAEQMDVPLEVIEVDVDAWDRGRGIEAAAREARFAALAQAAQALGTTWIALGHSLDDQVETVLMRLARGTSLDGLTAMRVASRRSVPLTPNESRAASVDVLRPLLSHTRVEIEQYAADFGLVPIEDPSNADPRFRRNAFRHQLLPLLEQIAPGSKRSIARSIRLLGSDASYLEALSEQAYSRSVRTMTPCRSIDRQALAGLPEPIQGRVIAQVIHELAPRIDLTSERIFAVRQAILSGDVSNRIQVGDGIDALVDYQRVVIGPAPRIEPTLRTCSGLPLIEPETELPIDAATNIALQNGWLLQVSLGAEHANWVLRTWRPGDRAIIGHSELHRLQDWFVNQKVPAYLRRHIPLLAHAGIVRWIPGFSSPTFEDVDSGLNARLVKSTKEDQPDDERVAGYPPA